MTGSVLLQAGRAEAEALGKAIASARAAPNGLEQMAQQMEVLTAHCLAYPEEMRRLWEEFEKSEPCAMVDDLIQVFEEHVALIDQRLQALNAVRDLVSETTASAGVRIEDAAFARAVDELLTLRARIVGLRDWYRRPLPPWEGTTETREERRAAFERGEYEDIESILARVRAGGPVCKDDRE